MSDGKIGMTGLDLSRQQLLYGPVTLATLISTDVSRLHLDGPVTMSEMARRQGIKDQLESGGETAHVEKIDPPSLQAIATARRIRR